MITQVLCPRCHTQIDARATRCNSCGAALDSAHDAIVVATVSDSQPLTDRPWFILIVLLHVGLLGIPYYLKTGYPWRTRLMMCLASTVYTVFAIVVIIWGCMQIYRAILVGA